MFAQVIVDVVHSNVAKPFFYLVPEGFPVEIGLRVLVSLGKRTVAGFVVGLTDTPPDHFPKEKIKPILKALDDYPALLPCLLSLAEEISEQTHCPLAEALRLMLPSAMRTGHIQVKTETVAKLASGCDVESAISQCGRAIKRKMLLQLLSDGKEHPVADFGKLISNPMEGLKKLQEMGLVELFRQEILRTPPGCSDIVPSLPPPLTPEQEAALGVMGGALSQGSGAFLLHGVTGSGKTEVYLAMVRMALAQGKGAIILVPEIALTPQMVRWFCARFGSETAVLHSRLSDGERYDEWRRIRLGRARVVVGARSAIFAPVENLGLIVIDEEHEQTYLNDKHPRYDARKIALSRGKREHATVLLSSATPSILSFAMARRGDYVLVEMPSRVNKRPLPTVTVVDMRKELECGNRSIFSRDLKLKMKRTLEDGNQVMLFLNRRGYNTFVSCRNCGYVVKCPQCDLSMTFHHGESGNSDEMLRCHMCGAVQSPPSQCPECGSPYIRYFGTGTQRVEEEVCRLFPGVETVRMDIDTTQGKDAHARLLKKFGSGEAKVLIGTQMIAKGLDFPKVTLVGVIAADLTLNLPDYRSPERTFQLITQVAGRAGRAETPGEVIVQTYKPDDACILAAAAQDYHRFFEMEFTRRRRGLYPPFTLIARLLCESETEEFAKKKAEELCETLRLYLDHHPAQKKKLLLLRQDVAPVKKIRGRFRYHVLVKLFDQPDAQPVCALMAELAEGTEESCAVYCEINPVTLM